MANASSPDYYSCEDNDDYTNLFQAKCHYYHEDDKKIDYFLKNSLSHVNYDSEMSIAAFPGCLRIGKVATNHLLNETELGFNKDNQIEIPIYFIPKFITELKSCIAFFIKEITQTKDEEILIGEVHHKIFLYSKKLYKENEKLISFIIKKNKSVTYEITFHSGNFLKYFTKQLFSIILDTTSPPKPQYQELTLTFLQKLDSKDFVLIQELFGFWHKNQKLKILWNAISEVVFEKNKNEINNNTFIFFNFIRKNLSIIESMNIIFKFVNLKY